MMDPLVISSDEEEEQDKTSPTSPPDHEKGHPAVYEYQPKSPAYPPPSDSSEEEDFSSIPDLVTPAEEMSPALTILMTLVMKHKVLSLLMSMPTRTVSKTRINRRP